MQTELESEYGQFTMDQAKVSTLLLFSLPLVNNCWWMIETLILIDLWGKRVLKQATPVANDIVERGTDFAEGLAYNVLDGIDNFADNLLSG